MVGIGQLAEITFYSLKNRPQNEKCMIGLAQTFVKINGPRWLAPVMANFISYIGDFPRRTRCQYVCGTLSRGWTFSFAEYLKKHDKFNAAVELLHSALSGSQQAGFNGRMFVQNVALNCALLGRSRDTEHLIAVAIEAVTRGDCPPTALKEAMTRSPFGFFDFPQTHNKFVSTVLRSTETFMWLSASALLALYSLTDDPVLQHQIIACFGKKTYIHFKLDHWFHFFRQSRVDAAPFIGIIAPHLKQSKEQLGKWIGGFVFQARQHPESMTTEAWDFLKFILDQDLGLLNMSKADIIALPGISWEKRHLLTVLKEWPATTQQFGASSFNGLIGALNKALAISAVREREIEKYVCDLLSRKQFEFSLKVGAVCFILKWKTPRIVDALIAQVDLMNQTPDSALHMLSVLSDARFASKYSDTISSLVSSLEGHSALPLPALLRGARAGLSSRKSTVKFIKILQRSLLDVNCEMLSARQKRNIIVGASEVLLALERRIWAVEIGRRVFHLLLSKLTQIVSLAESPPGPLALLGIVAERTKYPAAYELSQACSVALRGPQCWPWNKTGLLRFLQVSMWNFTLQGVGEHGIHMTLTGFAQQCLLNVLCASHHLSPQLTPDEASWLVSTLLRLPRTNFNDVSIRLLRQLSEKTDLSLCSPYLRVSLISSLAVLPPRAQLQLLIDVEMQNVESASEMHVLSSIIATSRRDQGRCTHTGLVLPLGLKTLHVGPPRPLRGKKL